MTYRFLPPRLSKATIEDCSAPAWRLSPEVPLVTQLNAETCRSLAEVVIKAHEAGQSWESRTRYAGLTPWNVNNKFRSSKNLPTSLPSLSAGYDALHAYAHDAVAGMGLGAETHELTAVDEQCLVYQTGDHIGDHADDSALAANEAGDAEWSVIKPDRHLVGILWLTTQTPQGTGRHEFAGGTFRFNSLVHQETGEPLDIRPTAGSMIVFPANPWFRHEVLTVTAGTRVALTRWWKASPIRGASR
ncbi:2OG-Fe(II) oxygenase [Variovorax sp. 770b2]|uniref:2OG-Fe(II) oxygenase n=1 Tax=Variovorax sp. 770b2 TaxID=1566271 RepID=UPI0008E4D3FC|nr:2OG-Fe(II) oxygenase [Variovorax sp. 770b2]SFQ11421.1 2OG-Fe(II) oxygenase superfamily protein [Variovorax sp. 770b2]